ncbi:dipeptidyl peptidase 4-like [Styela clava]
MARLRPILGVVILFALAACLTIWNTNQRSINTEKLEKREIKESYPMIKANNKKYMTFDDWLEGKFEPKSYYPDWVSDSEYIYKRNDQAILKRNITNLDECELLSSSAWRSLPNPSTFSASADLQYIVITYEHMDDMTSNPVQITNDGENNVIFNGITDWGYNLIFKTPLVWWSPNGAYFAYAKINQTVVKTFDFAYYGGDLYPKIVGLSYPKPGTPISQTSIYIVNTNNPTQGTKIKPTETVTNWEEYYLNSVVWRDNLMFTPTWKNRRQIEAVTETCTEANSWSCNHVSNEEIFTNGEGWLGNYRPSDLVPVADANEYLAARVNSFGYTHLVLVDVTNNVLDWRTNGSFEVTGRVNTDIGSIPVNFYDKRNDWAYFTSTEVENTEEGSARLRHLWRVKAHGNDKTRECITCDLNTIYTDRCNWVDSSFSPEGSNLIINCGGTGNGVPVSTYHHISESGNINFVEVKENNTQLIQNLGTYNFRTREYGELSLPQVDDEVFYYTLHKPENFDPSKKYPLLVQVYSGPGYQDTIDSFVSTWATGYIPSSDLDIVVMTFDGRGTGFRGEKIRNMVYHRLGEFEPLDQIEATRQISEKYDFVDKNRIAIWGRSYGGYITARTMSEDQNLLFKCGLSVAPVTDWMTYHNFYTERYMGLPSENEHAARLTKAMIEEDLDFLAYFAGDETHRFNRGKNAYGHHYKLLTHHLKVCFGL